MPAARTNWFERAFGKLSLQEKWGLAVSFLVASFVFAYNSESPFAFVNALPAALVAVAIAMAVHEYVQRKAAKRFGVSATYVMWLPGVVFSLLMMLVGVKLLVLGGAAVAAYKFSRWGMRNRHESFEEFGLVSMSGPVANLLLATVLMAFAGAGGVGSAIGYLASINVWFALYNMIPLKQLDGGGFFMWSHVYWLAALVWAVLLITPSGLLSGVLTFA